MGKIFSVAIIGCGSRGRGAYGKCMHNLKDKFKIVSLCDVNQRMLQIAREAFEVDEQNCFLDENKFFESKRPFKNGFSPSRSSGG